MNKLEEAIWCGKTFGHWSEHKVETHVEPGTKTIYMYEWCQQTLRFRRKPYVECTWVGEAKPMIVTEEISFEEKLTTPVVKKVVTSNKGKAKTPMTDGNGSGKAAIS